MGSSVGSSVVLDGVLGRMVSVLSRVPGGVLGAVGPESDPLIGVLREQRVRCSSREVDRLAVEDGLLGAVAVGRPDHCVVVLRFVELVGVDLGDLLEAVRTDVSWKNESCAPSASSDVNSLDFSRSITAE